MTGEERNGTLTLGKRKPSEVNNEEEEEEEEEEAVEELEREAKEMAERILDFRRTIPDQLMKDLSSRLLARRPSLRDLASEMPDNSRESGETSPTEADQGMLEKLKIFRAKTTSDVAAMPMILKRMNECIARMDKIEEYNVNIHSVFKKRM